LAFGFVLDSPVLGAEAIPQDDGAVVEIVGEGVISTSRNETFPAEDPVDGSLWFSVYDDSFGAQTIVRARAVEDGWTSAEVASFSGEWGDRAPRFSPDGSTLYFTSNRPRSQIGSPGDMNIWKVQRVDDGWGEPEILESPVNSAGNDIHASVTDRSIWLASNRDGGYGRSDIYRVSRDDGVMLHLPPPVNDANSQPDLWVSRDETWMILVITDHPEGYGGDDLYFSRFDGVSWTVPVNLGPVVNSAEYEYGPTVSADGTWLYFTSHRGEEADVYRVPVAVVPGGGH